MPSLSAKYMGFTLKNPLIAGSSGLTARVETMMELERNGIAAVVLKSLFEEDLVCHVDHPTGSHYPYPKTGEFIGARSTHSKVDDYLHLIEDAKSKLSVPVIASINCVTAYEWTSFARKIESAGADALEINLFILPSDPMRSSEENEKVYFDILNEVRRQVKIPLAVKISPYFSGMIKMALKLSWTGINGLVLFNRFYSPDMDIQQLKVIPGRIFSDPAEIYHSLRWVALLSDRVLCDLSGATGAHDEIGVIKFLLAGAKTVQITSTLYKNGLDQVARILNGLSAWMQEHQFECIKDFNGILSLKKAENPADYERFQYLRTFGIGE